MGLTATLADNIITDLYEEAASILGIETYSASDTQIDCNAIHKIVKKAATRILNGYYYSKYRDAREKTPALPIPDHTFNKTERSELFKRRLNIVESITVIDRYAS